MTPDLSGKPDLSYLWEGAREWCEDNAWDREK